MEYGAAWPALVRALDKAAASFHFELPNLQFVTGGSHVGDKISGYKPERTDSHRKARKVYV